MLRIRVSTSTSLKGLSMKSRAPASTARSFSDASPVIASTGNHVSGACACNAAMTANPSKPGMSRSSTIRSNGVAACSNDDRRRVGRTADRKIAMPREQIGQALPLCHVIVDQQDACLENIILIDH